MKISLITVGKTDVKWVKEGLEEYVSRLSRYVPFSLIEIPQLKAAPSMPQERVKEIEGEAVLKRIKPSDEVILLDERGKMFSSQEFASLLEGRMAHGSRDMVFVIGGAFGFSEKVYERASSLMSLSKMTFTHQMVRTIFAEQLYRAFTIIRGEPYHHE